MAHPTLQRLACSADCPRFVTERRYGIEDPAIEEYWSICARVTPVVPRHGEHPVREVRQVFLWQDLTISRELLDHRPALQLRTMSKQRRHEDEEAHALLAALHAEAVEEGARGLAQQLAHK
ncbi:MAG TPA: hypothetical protein VMQ93_19010 [Novosphingobium sp.]|nr:hypothetical protein [Novosphingobium sp.]